MIWLALTSLILAAIPALMFWANLRRYRPAPAPDGTQSAVSVLIPARNEEGGIVACVESVLQSRGVEVEVIVLDDRSDDTTGERVGEIASRDGRVRLIRGEEPPEGWCGKQYACATLARHAMHPFIVFLDADVRLEVDGLGRLATFLHTSGADLVSGIPRQEMGTLLERLLIPLIHFILLGFLPMARMRRSRHQAYAAGCGQLFLARREAYEQMGGHAAIRATLHDGIRLPRAFRAAGFMTDLCDATDLARCRMYRGAGEVWRGLAKNATEGLASPGMIGPATLLLLGGQVLPVVLLCLCAWLSPFEIALATVATALGYSTRLAGVVRFRQSLLGALLHPVGIVTLVLIQWYALGRMILGKPATWKGRSYAPSRQQAAGIS